MADEGPSSSAAAAQDDLTVSISVVSPSVSVNTPLNFPNLTPSTTVGEVKHKIREALESKPSNEHQRLIHQGKLLNREQETFLEVFGEQRLRESDSLVLHLVIREPPSADQPTSSTQTTAPHAQSPARSPFPRAANPFGANPQGPPQPAAPHGLHQHHGFHPGRFGRPAMIPGHNHAPFPGQPLGMPAALQPGPLQAEHAALQAQQQQMLHNYMHQLNNQRPVGGPGPQPIPGILHGGPGQLGNPHLPPGNNIMQGRNMGPQVHQPQPFVQQGVGPNGEYYRVTVNSAIISPNGPIPFPAPPMGFPQGNIGPSAPGGPISTNDVQNILRNADASEQASSIMANAMHRSASGASLPNLATGSHHQPIPPPGVTVPRRPGSTIPLSRTATPDATRTPSHGSTAASQSQGASSSPAQQPEVYILNSPQGPRALLISGPSSMYYTPAAPAAMIPPVFRYPPGWAPMNYGPPRVDPAWLDELPRDQPGPAAAPAQQQAQQQGNIRVGLYQGPAQQGAQQQQQQVRLQAVAPGAAVMPPHPANPEGGVAGAVMAAMWPHIWLLIRLTLFVWWFTSADTSWVRWLTVLSIAAAIFIVNTGILNNMAHDVFNPLRQHLEGLIPFGALEDNRNRRENPPPANAQPGQEVNNPAVAQARRQHGEPDPAQAAARLVEQRMVDNGNWLLNQIRRVERAGLLFLASIAPGVAERHIANMEAAERMERERQETAERAERERKEEEERAAAEAASAGAAAAAENAEGEGAGQASGKTPVTATGAAEPQPQPGAAA